MEIIANVSKTKDLKCPICGNKFWLIRQNIEFNIGDEIKPDHKSIVAARDNTINGNGITVVCSYCGHQYSLEKGQCLYNQCPGCEICKNWVSMDTVINVCRECIDQNRATEEFCRSESPCPWVKVRDHYGLTLDAIREMKL